MTRVTLDLDPTVYDALRQRAEHEGTPVDTFVAKLLAGAIKRDRPSAPGGLNWPARHMGAKFPVEDWAKVKELLNEELDEEYRTHRAP